MLDTRKKLSVVMPAYNEGEHIYENLKRVSDVLAGFIANYEIVVVNDGSKDDTRDNIIKYAKEDKHIKIISYKTNKGKGNAIKYGVEKAEGDYIAFLDSDLDLPPEQLKDYINVLLEEKADVVIGSKLHKDSKIDYPLIRRIISFGYYCMLRVLFRLDVKDTQTGIKMFKAEILKSIMPLIQTKGYAYDIEILVGLNSRGYKIQEMPIELIFQRGNGMGRIQIKDIVKVFKDTMAIFYRANIKKYYMERS